MALNNGNGSLSHTILSIALTALLGLIGWMIFSTNAKLDTLVIMQNDNSRRIGEISAIQQQRTGIFSDYEARLRLLETTVTGEHDALVALTKADDAIQHQLDSKKR